MFEMSSFAGYKSNLRITYEHLNTMKESNKENSTFISVMIEMTQVIRALEWARLSNNFTQGKKEQTKISLHLLQSSIQS